MSRRVLAVVAMALLFSWATVLVLADAAKKDDQAQSAGDSAPAAPVFTLTDTNGKAHSLADYQGKYVVLEWINDGCPFVKKHYNSGNMSKLQAAYTEKGVAWLIVCSSAQGKQGHHSAEEWNQYLAEHKAKATALLIDEDGAVGKLYKAKVTPHMYVIDPAGKIIYQGAIDDKPTADKADAETAHNYVVAALDQAMAGKPVATTQTKPYGCGVKYR